MKNFNNLRFAALYAATSFKHRSCTASTAAPTWGSLTRSIRPPLLGIEEPKPAFEFVIAIIHSPWTSPARRCLRCLPCGSATGTEAQTLGCSFPGRTPSKPGTWQRRRSGPSGTGSCLPALCRNITAKFPEVNV